MPSIVFTASTSRVKSVDIHATEPLVISALHDGRIQLWNYKTKSLVDEYSVADSPLRAVKFINRKNWFITGGDARELTVFHHETKLKVKTVANAHADFIRSIAIHPTQPFVLSSGDDCTIKLWNWERDWAEVRTFAGHTHYVMQVVFNPVNSSMFASASLDCTTKIWTLESETAVSTFVGHVKGVNAVCFATGADKYEDSRILTGADDNNVHVWDISENKHLKAIEGHSNNVTLIVAHRSLPIAISGSEDGAIRILNSTDFSLASEMSLQLQRVWTVACLPNSNIVAFGCDNGLAIVDLAQGTKSTDAGVVML